MYVLAFTYHVPLQHCWRFITHKQQKPGWIILWYTGIPQAYDIFLTWKCIFSGGLLALGRGARIFLLHFLHSRKSFYLLYRAVEAPIISFLLLFPLFRQFNRSRQCIVCLYRQRSRVYLTMNEDIFPRINHMEINRHSTSNTRRRRAAQG